ncbi:hypothetical protein P389DRAFT_183270 [Cystobasidium minutum MCA 4210]|uniref:uncharacterized protein n=1 Tax=Cystobasidium minutum MCA 4210 TaxID=1397322 RepID=UPI0034CF0AA8|eukprot:jgi/Rhomi1/183270/fgenesh1_pm.3_\
MCPEQLSLPAFLKLLTTGGVGLSTAEAMAAASPLIKAGYNKANVANPLTGISEPALVAAGVTDPDTRKQLVAYGRSGKSKLGSSSGSLGASGPAGKKRKAWGSDLDKPLPVKAEEKEAISLDFEEVTEDYLLHDRSVVINRAPVMTAWATVVAERLGFSRQEALSISHTYTNMNATSKGVSLGIYSPEKGKQRTTVGPSQPYVDLMGRKVPVLALQTGEWRGIANGAIAEPEQAFGYIQRSFRQNMSAAIGAFRLLAETIEPDELNKLGFNLYAEFRPEVHGWGERGHLNLGKVLDLRRQANGQVKVEEEKPSIDTNADVPEEVVVKARVDPDIPPSDPAVQVADGEGVGDSTSVKKEEPSEQEESLVEPPAKKVKVEADTDKSEEWDDGGIADDDLVGLI